MASDLRGMHKILSDRMEKEGWPNVKQFVDRSGIYPGLSHGTVRRVLTEHPKKPEPLTVAIVCRYLGMSRKAISDILKEYMSDHPNTQNIVWLIGDGTEDNLTVAEKSTIEAIKIITDANPTLAWSIAEHLDLLATAAGVDVQDLTKKLRRKKGG